MGRVIALEEEMDRAGAFAFGGALHGRDATTVVRGGTGLDKVTTDGPFVEAKEQIGGFYIVNAEDLDEALAWAAKVVEAINHDIEVRPFRATGRLEAGPVTDGADRMDDVERAFREARGQAVATLTRIFGDLTLAEDAVQDAFVTAVSRWPQEGVPDNPAGWIVATARNRAVDVVRRGRRGRQLAEQVADDRLRAEGTASHDDPIQLPDDQLRLIFTCCHPALRVEHQVALTLRLAAGLSPGEVASAFLVSEDAMAKRLVRAKYKIKAANIAYRVPDAGDLPDRLRAVLTVLYLIYNAGADDTSRRDLRAEAIWLTRVLVGLMPDEPEAAGLLALMLLSDAGCRPAATQHRSCCCRTRTDPCGTAP